MQMEWVNHASFILRSGQVSLLCDPWLEGTIFNRGWSLLSPTKFVYAEFASVTHIWVSNERQDRFNLTTLNNIPKGYRDKIKVLFLRTKNKRVVKACKELGFATEELPDSQIVEIAPDFKLMVGTKGVTDSWSAIFAEGKTLLNMNDCVFERQRDLEAIKQHVGSVDVLLSQFSYVNWVGNPDDRAAHKKHADYKKAEMLRQIRAFGPKQFIPFANYMFFSHVENAHMNQSSNRIGDVFHYLTRELNMQTVACYPGDRWEVGSSHDSAESIRRYNEDFDRASKAVPMEVASVSLEKLQEAARAFVRRSSEKNDELLLNSLPPAVVYVPDLEQHLELSFRRGLILAEGREADIFVSSDSLLDCLTTEYGGETLFVNGRFQVPAGGRPRRFFWIFPVSRRNSIRMALDLKVLGRQGAERTRGAAVGGA
jgi:L-ascorbate metabolism protein UlaG (beta-lactamase superfamily)